MICLNFDLKAIETRETLFLNQLILLLWEVFVAADPNMKQGTLVLYAADYIYP